MKIVENGQTYEILSEPGGGQQKVPRNPVVRWEANPLTGQAGQSIMLRGSIEDFDGEQRTDSFSAKIEVDYSMLFPVSVGEGMLTADVVIPTAGVHTARIAGPRLDNATLSIIVEP